MLLLPGYFVTTTGNEAETYVKKLVMFSFIFFFDYIYWVNAGIGIAMYCHI